MVNHLILGERLDSAAAVQLREDLSGFEGEALSVDASKVELVGGLCLELLLLAGKIWIRAGHAFSVDNPSEGFTENLARLGLSPEDLNSGETS